jgi:ankyrin repeat protein
MLGRLTRLIGIALVAGLLLPAAPASATAAEKKDDDAFQSALIAALHHFANAGDLDHLKAVLEKYPRLVNAKRPQAGKDETGKYTALHHAVAEGHIEVVKYLLSHGADIEADGGHGWRPLHLAASNDDLRIVQILVEKGADIGAKTDFIPEQAGAGNAVDDPVTKEPAIPSKTAIQIAQEHKHEAIAKYLSAKLREQKSRQPK